MAHNLQTSTVEREQRVSWRATIIHRAGELAAVCGTAAQKASDLSQRWIYDPLARQVEERAWRNTAAVIRGTGSFIKTCGDMAKFTANHIREVTRHRDISDCEVRIGYGDKSYVLKRGCNAEEEVPAFELPIRRKEYDPNKLQLRATHLATRPPEERSEKRENNLTTLRLEASNLAKRSLAECCLIIETSLEKRRLAALDLTALSSEERSAAVRKLSALNAERKSHFAALQMAKRNLAELRLLEDHFEELVLEDLESLDLDLLEQKLTELTPEERTEEKARNLKILNLEAFDLKEHTSKERMEERERNLNALSSAAFSLAALNLAESLVSEDPSILARNETSVLKILNTLQCNLVESKLPSLSPALVESEIAAQENLAAIQEAREATDQASATFVRLSAAFCTFSLVLNFLPELVGHVQGEPVHEMTHFVNEEDSLQQTFNNYFAARQIELSFVQKMKVRVLFMLTEHYIHQCTEELANHVKDLIRTSLSDREKFSEISKRFLKNFSNFFDKCLQSIARKQRDDQSPQNQGRVPGLNTEHLMAQFHRKDSDFFPTDERNINFTNPQEIYELFARNIHKYLPEISFKNKFLDYCHIRWTEEVQAGNGETLRKITEVTLSVLIAIPLLFLTIFDWVANKYIIPLLIDRYLPDLVENIVNTGLNNVGTNNYSYALTKVFREQVEATIEKLSQPEDLEERGSEVEEHIIDPETIQTFVGKLLDVVDRGVFEDAPEDRWKISDIGTTSLLTKHLSRLFSYMHGSMIQKTNIEKSLAKFLGLAIQPFLEGRLIEPGVLTAEKDLAKTKTTELVKLLTDSGSYEKIWGIDETDQRKLHDRFTREVFRKPIEKDLRHVHERLQYVHFHLDNYARASDVELWSGQMHQCLQNAASVANQRYEAAKNIPNLSTKFKEHLKTVKERLVVQTNDAVQLVSNTDPGGQLGLEELHRGWTRYYQLNDLWEDVHSSFTTKGNTTKPLEELLEQLNPQRVQEIRRFLNRISELTRNTGKNLVFTLGSHAANRPEVPGFINECHQVLNAIQFIQHSRKALDALKEFSSAAGAPALPSVLDQIINFHRSKLEEDEDASQIDQFQHHVQRSLSFALGYHVVLANEELQQRRTEFLDKLRENIRPEDTHEIEVLFQRLATAQTVEQVTAVAETLKQNLSSLATSLREGQEPKAAEITALLDQSLESRIKLLEEPRMEQEPFIPANHVSNALQEDDLSDIDEVVPDNIAPITCLKVQIADLAQKKRERVDGVLTQINQMKRTLFEIQNPKIFQLGLSTLAQVGLAYYSLPYFGAFYLQQMAAAPVVFQQGLEKTVKNLSARGVSEYYSQSITNYVRRVLKLSEERVVSTAVLALSAHTINQIISSEA